MMASATQRLFLSSPKFAVVGASKDRNKIGNKVLKWYQIREKLVTPIHPRETELEGLPTVSSISELPDPSNTSISIISPPKVTLDVLRQAKQYNIPALWIQPGAEDTAVVEYIKENGLSDRAIFGGACILTQGDSILKSML